MRCFVLLVCLMTPTWATAQAWPFTVPEKVEGKPGEFVTVSAVTEGKTVRWLVMDPGLQLFPSELLRDSKTAVVIGQAAGKYRLAVYTAINGEPTPPIICTVILGGPAPIPPPPPGPTPPPAPVALVARLQAAFTADPKPLDQKQAALTLLCGLYQAMGPHCDSKDLKTVGDLLADLKAVAAKMIVPGALTTLRQVIATEIAGTLGTTPGAVLDDATRTKAKDCFHRIANALGGVK